MKKDKKREKGNNMMAETKEKLKGQKGKKTEKK